MEIEEVEQVGLRGVAVGEVRGGVDEAVFYELDDGGVVHGDVRDVVLAGEGRDDHVGEAESELGGEALLGGRVTGIRAGIGGQEIAMESGDSTGGKTGFVAVGVDRDGTDIGDGAEGCVGVVVGMSGDGRNVVERSTGFVVTQKKDTARPG